MGENACGRKEPLHSWQLTPKEAVQLQCWLCAQVIARGEPPSVALIAGIDVGLHRTVAGKVMRAAVVLLSWPGLQVVEEVVAEAAPSFPYVPGLLSFREAPVVLEALTLLRRRPQLLFCDGQGIAHPRRFGIASHLGLWLQLPSIGCAKSILVGEHQPLAPAAGARQPLLHKGEEIGTVLRSKVGCRPLIVSAGHLVGQKESVSWVERCLRGYRLPEPTRLAHRLASK